MYVGGDVHRGGPPLWGATAVGGRMGLGWPISVLTGVCPAGSGAIGQRRHPYPDRMPAGASAVRDPGGL